MKGLPSDASGMRRLKAMGFSDSAARPAFASLRPWRARDERGDRRRRDPGLGPLSAMKAMTGGITEAEVRAHRVNASVCRPVFKRIDSCAAEFDAGDALSLLDLRGATCSASSER